MNSRPPIIIFGMHRSGTSMVTRLLEELGLFVGWRKDPNNEAMLFLQLNDWMLRLCGGAWDQPLPIRHLHRDEHVRALVLDYLRSRMAGARSAGFLGPTWRPWLRSLFELDRPWGWKDPRNTFTLPIWRDLFPNAKAIHVYRHGVAVASSLRARRGTSADSIGKNSRLWSAPLQLFRQPVFVDSMRCGTLEGGLSLWEEYMAEARTMVAACGADAVEVKYEDFLTNPEVALCELAAFCGLDTAPDEVARVAQRVRRERADAFRQDPESAAMAGKAGSRLAVFGY